MGTFKVLSIDGGGIRGLIPAMILQEIERVTHHPISRLFDLIAGTSTGGLIACALTVPDKAGHPKISAQELVHFYEDKGPEIFARSFFHTLATLGGWSGEKYPHSPFERELIHLFGSAALSDAIVPLLIPAYEIERRFPFFFKSHRAKSDSSYDFPLWQVVRATTAAPTYFTPAKVTSKAGHSYALIDGGTFANNPAMCAYVEAQATFEQKKEIIVVSLGTGRQETPIPYQQAKDWGKIGWALPLLDVMMDGVSDTVDYQLIQLLGSERYYRFQADLTIAGDDMDDASPLNIQKLKRQAEKLLETERERFSKLYELFR